MEFSEFSEVGVWGFGLRVYGFDCRLSYAICDPLKYMGLYC